MHKLLIQHNYHLKKPWYRSEYTNSMIKWSKYKKAGNLFSLLALQKDHAMVFKKGTSNVLSFKKLGKYWHTTVLKYCMIEHVYAY